MKAASGLVAVGVLAIAIGITGPGRWIYLGGCAILTAGLLAFAVVVAEAVVWSTISRRIVAIGLAVIVAVVGMFVPAIVYRLRYPAPLWQTTAEAFSGVVRVGARLYVHGQYSDQILDVHTGRTILSVPSGKDALVVGQDGSFAQLSADNVTYRDRNGNKRWTLRSVADPFWVLAIDDGWVVVDGCRRAGAVCGIRPDGSIGWQAPAVGKRLPELAWLADRNGYFQRPRDSFDETDFNGIEAAPRVAVRNVGKPSTVEIYKPGIGRVLRTPGNAVGVRDDQALVVRQDCQLVALSDRGERWHTSGLPCSADFGWMVLMRHRLYVPVSKSRKHTLAVDLSDGSTASVGPMLTRDEDTIPDLTSGIPGDDVAVERQHRRLTGRDADTGKALWTYDAVDDRAGVDVENGSVMVFGYVSIRLPVLAGRDNSHRAADSKGSDQLLEVTVLDARTGKVTGRRLVGSDSMGSGGLNNLYGIGPGRALVIVNRGDAYAIGAD